MDQRAFVKAHSGSWNELEALIARAGRRGLRRLSGDELFTFGRLYRWVTSDLSYASGHDFDPELQQYLNRLTARAHAYVYGAGVESWGVRARRFFGATFPNEVRRSWAAVGICAALTVLWAMVAYAVVQHNPADAYAMMPEWLVPAHISKSLHDSNFAFGPAESASASSFIITNNIRVAILTFAGGIVTLGAGTIYLITFNGLMLGALSALYAQAGFGADFWATVAPHGFIELTAIQIAGGAGLLIAAGVLFPGRLRRRDAIARNGRRAGVLIAGVAAMLCVAGIIEGFFSPLRLPIDVRAGFGIGTALLLLSYFAFAGRGAERVEATTPPAF